MEKQKKFSKGLIIALVVFCLLVAGTFIAWKTLAPKGEAGDKTIQVEVIAEGTEPKAHTIETDAQFLRQALEEQNLIAGDESVYGLFVKTVDGITADDANEEWWSFTKAGEMLMTGVDDTPIADGDHFEITLTVGFDYDE